MMRRRAAVELALDRADLPHGSYPAIRPVVKLAAQ